MAILVVGHHEDSWKSTYLEVRLLMTPVVVLNCSARAKIVVMPIKKFHHIRLVEVKAQEPFILYWFAGYNMTFVTSHLTQIA